MSNANPVNRVVTADEYADLCDLVSQASERMPFDPEGCDFTSDYARAGANRVLDILGIEMPPLDLTPAVLAKVEAYKTRMSSPSCDTGHKHPIAAVLRAIITADSQMGPAANAAFDSALHAGRRAMASDEAIWLTEGSCHECHRLHSAVARLVRAWDALELVNEDPSLAGPAAALWDGAVRSAADILWLTTGQYGA